MQIRSSWLRTLVATAVVVAVSSIHAVEAIDTPAVQNANTASPVVQSAATATTASKTKPKIIVLGAGMSGVMAAKTLYEKGFTDITIIEANDYIGGRMKAGSMAGRAIEYGANWIHGAAGNPIYDLAVSKKLNLVETNWSSEVILPLGADPNVEAEQEKFEEAFTKMEERAARYLKDGKDDLAVTDALLYEGWSPKTPVENALLYNELDLDMGPADESSFKLDMNIATYENDDLDMLVVDSKNYNSLAHDLLATNFPSPLNNSRVILNTLVDKIQYKKDGVTITAKNRKTGKAATYNADFVITTFSAGVLRNKAPKLFMPTLPEDKLDAIYRIRMTLFLKVFVEVTEKFWAEDTQGAESWIYADAVTGNFTSWVDLSLPKLGAAFASPKNGSYLAFCMLGGKFAERVQKLTPTQLKDEVVHVFRGMFPKAADRINTKTVANVVVHNWGSDELFSGSWANPPPGFTKKDFAKLAEPVGRVYFSGEHTSAEYFGYVHGAYRAGIATAEQLMQRPEFK